MISSDNDASVVLVEHPLICRYVRSVLADRTERALVDAQAAHAIQLVQSADSKVCLLITNRPAEFLPFAEELPLVYVSSHPEHGVAKAFRSCRMLHKPFGPNQLAAAVSELLGPVVS